MSRARRLNCTTGLGLQGGHVNLEKALRLSDRLGGHMVSGHVDGVGEVIAFNDIGESWRLVVRAPQALAKYIAMKGSITINGVSLTVNQVSGSEFEVNLIPHTLDVTTLNELKVGAKVNLEIDLIARYVERMLTAEAAVIRPPDAFSARAGECSDDRIRNLTLNARIANMTDIAPITEIIDEIRAGRMVVLVDEEDRENEGDLLFAAEFVTPEAINFMIRHARGLVCLTLTEERCRQLGISHMARDNKSPLGTNFTVSIEAAVGVTTGISASDRATTIKAAVKKNAGPDDIVQPGHIFPIMARPGGVLVRAGHTEAGCDLAQMAGVMPAAVICEIIKEDGEMARLPDLIPFAKEHGLKIGTIADLIEYRIQTETLVERVARRKVQTAYGEFDLVTYTDKTTQRTHLALVKGNIQPQTETVVRVHEPLSALDFLEQVSLPNTTSVHDALEQDQPVRGGRAGDDAPHRDFVQLCWRVRRPTPEAHHAQWDPRSYGIGAQILRDLNVGKMCLIATPRKLPSMTGFGLEVVRYCQCKETK